MDGIYGGSQWISSRVINSGIIRLRLISGQVMCCCCVCRCSRNRLVMQNIRQVMVNRFRNQFYVGFVLWFLCRLLRQEIMLCEVDLYFIVLVLWLMFSQVLLLGCGSDRQIFLVDYLVGCLLMVMFSCVFSYCWVGCGIGVLLFLCVLSCLSRLVGSFRCWFCIWGLVLIFVVWLRVRLVIVNSSMLIRYIVELIQCYWCSVCSQKLWFCCCVMVEEVGWFMVWFEVDGDCLLYY